VHEGLDDEVPRPLFDASGIGFVLGDFGLVGWGLGRCDFVRRFRPEVREELIRVTLDGEQRDRRTDLVEGRLTELLPRNAGVEPVNSTAVRWSSAEASHRYSLVMRPKARVESGL
jgi:hypothetical protein